MILIQLSIFVNSYRFNFCLNRFLVHVNIDILVIILLIFFFRNFWFMFFPMLGFFVTAISPTLLSCDIYKMKRRFFTYLEGKETKFSIFVKTKRIV